MRGILASTLAIGIATIAVALVADVEIGNISRDKIAALFGADSEETATRGAGGINTTYGAAD